jgi:TonB family protein
MFRRDLHPRVALGLLLLLPSLAYAGVSNAQLEQEYVNKVLTLREFDPGSKLHFDSAGKLSKPEKPGPWTVYGQLRPEKISLKDGVVHIQGQRLFLFYDPAAKQLRDFLTMSKDEAQTRHVDKKILEKAAKEAKVEVVIEVGTGQPELADVAKAMNAVFFAPDESITDSAPIYWKHWLEHNGADQELTRKQLVNVPQEKDGPYIVGKGVSPPHADYTPDPEYADIARTLRYQGTVVLWLILSKDGRPTHIRVQRALGLGLDDMAVAAVERWKFTPAKKDGEPVPVMINVEVNFKLY